MYKEYHESWYLKNLAKRDLDNLLSKKDVILSELTKTASELKDTNVNSSRASDKMGKLIAAKIDLENVIKYQQILYDSRAERTDEKLEDLKLSKDLDDIIYLLKYVSKFKTKEVSKVISYTREYTYELISKIRDEMKQIEKRINENLKKKNNVI